MNAALFYQQLATKAGARHIACLKPDSCSTSPLQDRLAAWRQAGNDGALPYLDKWSAILTDPFAARPWACSGLVLSFAPAPCQSSPLFALPPARPGRPSAAIAAYALCEDYHRQGQHILEQLCNALCTGQNAGDAPRFDTCVDTKPVMEKELALLAGLGVRGRNGLLRTTGYACQAHLAVLFTSLDLPQHLVSPPHDLACGDCHACVAICPNRAIGPDGVLRVRLCRSWLANEKRGALSWPEQRLLGPTLFACSHCSSCCPDAPQARNDYLVDAEDLFRLPSANIARIISGTALDHTGATLLKRNAAAAFAQQCPQVLRLARQPELIALTNSPAIRDTIAAWE